MNTEAKPRILVVEDEGITAKYIARKLELLGYAVVGRADTGLDALHLAAETAPDLVLMDIMLQGGMDGIQTTEELHRRIDVPVIYLTANTDPATMDRARATRPHGYLVKPFDELGLKTTIDIALFRHQSEATQRLYQRAIDASESAIFIADARRPGFPIVRVNPAFERMTGYSCAEAVGRGFQFLEGAETDQAASDRLREALEKHVPCHAELRHARKDRSVFWSEITLAPVPDAAGCVTHFVGVQNNVTAFRQMEAQLRQAQKLESIGQLAAGIAHEINTPAQYIGDNMRFQLEAFAGLGPYFESHARLLAAAKAGAVTPEIIAAAQSATETADIDYLCAEIPNAIQQSLEGIKRVTRIVSAMKKFSHPGTEEMVMTNVNEAIESTLAVSRNEWKYTAEAVMDLDPDLPLIHGFPGELNQTFLNLIVNASHAIADAAGDAGGKGSITITTRQSDDQVEIRFSDTGTGIPEKIRHRIFDPFFTTKDTGKGTGQGLAIAWSAITEKHAGTIVVESETGKGTTFIIRLPVQSPEHCGREQVA